MPSLLAPLPRTRRCRRSRPPTPSPAGRPGRASVPNPAPGWTSSLRREDAGRDRTRAQAYPVWTDAGRPRTSCCAGSAGHWRGTNRALVAETGWSLLSGEGGKRRTLLPHRAWETRLVRKPTFNDAAWMDLSTTRGWDGEGVQPLQLCVGRNILGMVGSSHNPTSR